MDKRLLRKKILEQRNALSEDEIKIYSRRIRKRLCDQAAFLSADVVLSYAPYGSEVDVSQITHHNMYLPRVTDAKEGKMEFYNLTPDAVLEMGYKGIFEPVSNIKFVPEMFEGSVLIILPGVVFDKKGNRIGYGKGFYDRYLKRLSENNQNVTKIAVAFECQILDSIDGDVHDVPYDVLISPDNVY